MRWSCCVRAADGSIVLAEDASRLQPTASIGKLFLLVAAAEGIVAGHVDPTARLARPPEAIADSGLWQHLSLPALTVADAAVLTAAVSDNLAANALLDLVGHDCADSAALALGCDGSRLLDRIRVRRTPVHPHAPSQGRADELSEVVRHIEQASSHRESRDTHVCAADDGDTESISAHAAEMVRNWLLTGVDLSMVGSAFGLDPLAHVQSDRGVTLWNKTGTDATVRADIGVVTGPLGWFAYAALAEWTDHENSAATGEPDGRDESLARMHALGDYLRTLVGCDR